jgi:hypothetical protein
MAVMINLENGWGVFHQRRTRAWVQPLYNKSVKTTIIQMDKLSSMEIILSKRLSISSGISGAEVVKRSAKWAHSVFPIAWRSEIQAPLDNFRKSIAVLRRLITVERWKNFVFKSLHVSHCSRDLFRHSVSSWRLKLSIALCKPRSWKEHVDKEVDCCKTSS